MAAKTSRRNSGRPGGYYRPLFAPAFGALGDMTAANMTTAAGVGLNQVNIACYWDRLQAGSTSKPAVSTSEMSNINTLIADAKSRGMKVLLSFDVQYPPDWVLALPKLIDQAGVTWGGTSATPGIGENIRDFIWSQLCRDAIADFVSKTSAAITDRSPITGLRVGGGPYNEIRLPGNVNDGNAANLHYWHYSAAALGGSDLATGMAANPWPAYTIYGGDTTKDAAVEAWAFDSMARYVDWWCGILETAGWAVPYYLMHTSTMVRSTWASTYYGRKLEVASLAEPRAVMDRYKLRTWARTGCTWLDEQGIGAWGTQVLDDTKSVAHFLDDLAIARGIPYPRYGENAGGGNDTNMDTIFANAISLGGYQVVQWAFWPSLVAGTSGTLAHYGVKASAEIASRGT